MNTRDLVILIVLLVLNLIYVVLQLVLGIVKYNASAREKKQAGEVNFPRVYVVRGIVALLCPIAAPLIFLLAGLFKKLFFHRRVDLTDVMFSQERVKTFEYADEERDMNMAPLEEALAVSDKNSLRNLMMNIVRSEDKGVLLSQISMALNSKDSETAHYAASVLSETLDKFRLYAANAKKAFDEADPEDDETLVLAKDMIETMSTVLSQDVFDELEQEKYVMQLVEVCDWIYMKNADQMQVEYYEMVCEQTRKIKKYDVCEKWCDRLVNNHRNTLASYTCRIKLYFSMGNRELFFRELDALKRSHEINIDKETLELIRTFS